MKTTFQSHGLTWTRHTPGDPMPCDPVALVEVLLRCEEDIGEADLSPEPASSLEWGTSPFGTSDLEIIGWRYAENETPHDPAPLGVQKEMNLRDWFAGQALSAILSNPQEMALLSSGIQASDQWSRQAQVLLAVKQHAYRYADAMLEGRENQ